MTLRDDLQQERREKEWAETWTPDQPGDALIGMLEEYDEASTDFGTYTVAHIRTDEGVLKGLWLMHKVLQDEWSDAGPEGEPQIGDRVGAMYHGQRSGDDYDYHMWSVKVDPSADADGQMDPSATEDGAPGDKEPAPHQAPARSTPGTDDGPTLEPDDDLPFS
jgi:hypothetical protein